MKIEKVIVVFKKSAYQVYGLERKNADFLNLIEKNHFTVASLEESHHIHQGSLESVKNILDGMNIKSKFVYRSRRFQPKDADLILTLGGDGTFLEASRSVENIPMLGVNSNPKSSVGMYCGIHVADLEKTLNSIQNNELSAINLPRLKIKLNDETLSHKVLNDVLICNSNPASSSRFVLELPDLEKEEYVSSGIWVSTPSGSTAAMRSAGGRVMPIEGRCFEYLVREMYTSHLSSPKKSEDILHEGETLKIYSRMRKGALFIDGAHHKVSFTTGSELIVSLDKEPVKVFAYNLDRRQEVFQSV